MVSDHMLEGYYCACTAWCSEISSLTSLDACNSGASSDRRKPISLHQAVLWKQQRPLKVPFLDEACDWLLLRTLQLEFVKCTRNICGERQTTCLFSRPAKIHVFFFNFQSALWNWTIPLPPKRTIIVLHTSENFCGGPLVTLNFCRVIFL